MRIKPALPKCRSRKTATRAPAYPPLPTGGLGRSVGASLCTVAAATTSTIANPIVGLVRSGSARRRTRSPLTTRSAGGTSQLDQPSVVNIAWASAAPTGPQGLAGCALAGSAPWPGQSAGS